MEGKGFGLNLPEVKIKLVDIKKGVNLLEFLSKNQITTSKGDARRIIGNKGLKINNKIVENEKRILSINDFKDERLKISLGKKKHFVVKVI